MQRILIIEDHKATADLLADGIKTQLHIDVDVAYKLAEAKLFLRMYDYDLTIVDLVLPDATSGEAVDYVLSKKGNKVLVLSANIDNDFRKKILSKNIIDYIHKTPNFVNDVVAALTRLKNNKSHTVLVVDDSMVFRNQMKNLLENLFLKVITVAHGEEALGMLESHPEISLVITDYNMPVMNGLELTKTIRQTYTKNDLHIIAISSSNDDQLTAMFLKNGANDYITKPYSKEEFTCRVNNSIELLESFQLITNHANRDFLTGLYNRRYFFKTMEEYTQTQHPPFAIAMLDIDFFKKINDTYGHDVGDQAIVHLAEILHSSTNHTDLVARFGGEEFCIILKNMTRENALNALERIHLEVENSVIEVNEETQIRYTISIGATMYSEDEGLEESINQADMMLYNAKKEGRNRVIFG